MYNFYDSRNPISTSIYFTAIIVVGSFFLLNLLLATIWLTFTKIRDTENSENNIRILLTTKNTRYIKTRSIYLKLCKVTQLTPQA